LNICLVIARPDRYQLAFTQQPVESLYAATSLLKAGHRAEIWDTRIHDQPEATQLTFDPDLFVVITQTYDLTQCYSISVNNSRALVDDLRKQWPGVPIVAAGMHADVAPAMTAHDLRCDASLTGELEASLPWLADQLAADSDALRRGLDNAPRFADPQALPVPEYGLIDVNAYSGEIIRSDGAVDRGTTGLIFANRGCPYDCSYCFVWFGKRLRKRPVQCVVAELAAQLRSGVRNFFFLDYTFTLDRAWVSELCTAIKRAELDISWLCQTRCERVSLDLLVEMRSAGCAGVYYGVEAPWIATTDMSKPMSRATINAAIENTVAAGLHPFIFVIFGLEGYDEAKAWDLYEFLRTSPATFYPSTILPRPFTELWNRHTKGKKAPRDWNECDEIANDLRNRVYLSPGVIEIHERIRDLPSNVKNRVTPSDRKPNEVANA
jgi:anaerobic magnesium-protoporphyrin IX monomethyl ester cyclase